MDFVRNTDCAVLVRQILRQDCEAWCLIERRRKPEVFKNRVRCRRCWDHVTLVDLVFFYQGGAGLESCRACVYVWWHTIDFRLSHTIGRWPKPCCLATKCHVVYWTLQTASRQVNSRDDWRTRGHGSNQCGHVTSRNRQDIRLKRCSLFFRYLRSLCGTS